MTSPLSMFYDKSAVGNHFSMTRLIAFLFALVFLLTLWTYADKAIPINWAFATLGCVVLLAVPIQAIFAYLQQWIASQPGQDLLTTAIHKIEDSLMPSAPPSSTIASTVSSTVTTTPVVPAEKG